MQVLGGSGGDSEGDDTQKWMPGATVVIGRQQRRPGATCRVGGRGEVASRRDVASTGSRPDFHGEAAACGLLAAGATIKNTQEYKGQAQCGHAQSCRHGADKGIIEPGAFSRPLVPVFSSNRRSRYTGARDPASVVSADRRKSHQGCRRRGYARTTAAACRCRRFRGAGGWLGRAGRI